MQAGLARQQRAQLGVIAMRQLQLAWRVDQPQHAFHHGLQRGPVCLGRLCVRRMQAGLHLSGLPLQLQQGGAALPHDGLVQAARSGIDPLGQLLLVAIMEMHEFVKAVTRGQGNGDFKQHAVFYHRGLRRSAPVLHSLNS